MMVSLDISSELNGHFRRCQILNTLIFFHHFCNKIFLSKYTHPFIWIFIQNFDEISRGAAMLRRIRLSVNKCYGTKTEKYFSTFKTILGLFTSENSQCVSTNCCCCCRLDLDNAFQSLNIDTNTYLPADCYSIIFWLDWRKY